MHNREEYIKPIILSALFIGVLSGLPGISSGNCCCCFWVVLGGALSSYLLLKESKQRVSSGDGLRIGLLSGAIGGAISSFLKGVFWLFSPPWENFASWLKEIIASSPQPLPWQVDEFLNQMNKWTSPSGVFMVFQFISSVLIFSIAGAIGAVLMVLIFGPRFELRAKDGEKGVSNVSQVQKNIFGSEKEPGPDNNELVFPR